MRRTVLTALVVAMAWTPCVSAEPIIGGNQKDFGVAINPVFALFGWFKGELNIWSLDRTGEINLVGEYASNHPLTTDENIDLGTLGGNYRKFFNDAQEGYFVQGGLLFHVGEVDRTQSGVPEAETSAQMDIVFGVGYRTISQTNGLFWGLGMGVGRRFGEIVDADDRVVRDSGFAFSFDVFKVGYAW